MCPIREKTNRTIRGMLFQKAMTPYSVNIIFVQKEVFEKKFWMDLKRKEADTAEFNTSKKHPFTSRKKTSPLLLSAFPAYVSFF